MVASMTGFSRCTHQAPWGTLTWEIRSVNHRFLESSVRLPENLRSQEMLVREHIQNAIKRGKVEANLKFTVGTDLLQDLVVNEPLLQQLAAAVTKVSHYFPNSVVNPLDILNWQGMLETEQTHLDAIATSAIQLLKQSLAQLIEGRSREGAGIKFFLEARIKDIHNCIEQITLHLPQIKEHAREKVKLRFAELTLEVNSERLEQEMVWLLQKMDVAEELQRLSSHLEEVQRTLESDDVVGRRLDFLMQELNREANTLGSKSVDSKVVQWVVEMKVQIEQMREQVQNIE